MLEVLEVAVVTCCELQSFENIRCGKFLVTVHHGTNSMVMSIEGYWAAGAKFGLLRHKSIINMDPDS